MSLVDLHSTLLLYVQIRSCASLTINQSWFGQLDAGHDLCQVSEGGIGTRDHLKNTHAHTHTRASQQSKGTFIGNCKLGNCHSPVHNS